MISNTIPSLPFRREADRVVLTGPVFLSCGCGVSNARWATVSQNMKTKLPHGKPRSSKLIHDWLEQEGLFDKWPILKKHTYGIVVAHTDKGYEYTDIMTQTTTKTVSNIADLIERSTDVRDDNQTAR